MFKLLKGKASIKVEEMNVLGQQTQNYSNADIEAVVSTAFNLNIEKTQEADHFLKKKGPKEIYARYSPCFCQDQSCEGVKRSLFDLPSDSVDFPKISMELLETAIKITKGKENAENKEKMEAFISTYGNGLIKKQDFNDCIRTRSHKKCKFEHIVFFCLCILFTTFISMLFFTFIVMPIINY